MSCHAFAFIAFFFTHQVELNRKYRVHQLLPVLKSSAFKNSRSIFLRHNLDKGRYVLVACTFEPGVKAKHLLRLYTTGSNHAR
jgi:calpain-5